MLRISPWRLRVSPRWLEEKNSPRRLVARWLEGKNSKEA